MDNELLSFKDRTPYTVPEGFFEQSKAHLLATLAEAAEKDAVCETAKTVAMPRRPSHQRRWIQVAAAVVLVAVVGGLAIPQFRSSSQELAMATDTATTQVAPSKRDDRSQAVGLYALAEDDEERAEWTDFGDDDIFMQE